MLWPGHYLNRQARPGSKTRMEAGPGLKLGPEPPPTQGPTEETHRGQFLNFLIRDPQGCKANVLWVEEETEGWRKSVLALCSRLRSLTLPRIHCSHVGQEVAAQAAGTPLPQTLSRERALLPCFGGVVCTLAQPPLLWRAITLKSHRPTGALSILGDKPQGRQHAPLVCPPPPAPALAKSLQFLARGPRHTWENWANVRSASMGTCPSSSWQQSLWEARSEEKPAGAGQQVPPSLYPPPGAATRRAWPRRPLPFHASAPIVVG